ncbi:hypothetical protein BpHYR1_053979 [Brachionus plicatilis]|uniref:Uncharacterized protein n=1 Tax=Brachionus plicatilis TaxID=10195 RepID=A0A3M7PNC6_BRAPC|nr:hypothetical protein BpHYR1_053979 [Brachionus plicatilis]
MIILFNGKPPQRTLKSFVLQLPNGYDQVKWHRKSEKNVMCVNRMRGIRKKRRRFFYTVKAQILLCKLIVLEIRSNSKMGFLSQL